MLPAKRSKRDDGGGSTPPTPPHQHDQDLGDPPQVEKNYVVQKVQERKIAKYGVEEYVCRARFKDDFEKQNIANVKDDLLAMFGEVLKEGAASYTKGEKLRVSVEHQSLDKAMTIHLQPRENITPEVILSRLETVLNSKQNIDTDETFEVKVGTWKKGDNGGGGPAHILDSDMDSAHCAQRMKTSIVFIPAYSGETICGARAIVTCMAKLEGMSSADFKNFIHKRNSLSKNPRSQRMKALELLREVGLPSDEPLAVREIHKIEAWLDVQIIVVSGNLLNEVCYTGCEERLRKIFLYLKDGHFHAVMNVNALVKNMALCTHCFQWHSEGTPHVCAGSCLVCKRSGCKWLGAGVMCQDCNFLCRSVDCHTAHKTLPTHKKGPNKGIDKSDASNCDTYYKCNTCAVVINRKIRALEKHVCGEYLCPQCKSYVVGVHHCYYRIKMPKTTAGRFLYYDFETSQDRVMECPLGYRNIVRQGCPDCVADRLCANCRKCRNCARPFCGRERFCPNYLVCQTVCDECENHAWSDDAVCPGCGDRCPICSKKGREGECMPLCPNGRCGAREKVFKGVETAELFCRWLLTEQHRKFVCIAHNNKAFDAHFILNYCINNGVTPSVIFTGSKIMRMEIKRGLGIVFIDSLSFLPMALSRLSTAMGLESGVEKGHFPHLFNTQENFEYIGRWPAKEFYSPDFMSRTQREEFLAWYETVKDDAFCFQEQILAYTRSDVRVLREACTRFRALIKAATTFPDSKSPPVDVFAHATLASCSMQIIRQLCLKEEHVVQLKDGETDASDAETGISGEGEWIGACLKAGVWRRQDTGEEIPSDDIATTKFCRSQLPQPPVRGYTPKETHSLKGVMWAEWIGTGLGRRLQHARNGSEYTVPGTRYRADAYDPVTGKLYDFYGCLYHGHACTNSRHARDPTTRFTMGQKYELTMKREREIKGLGFELETIWECEWERMVISDAELEAFVREFDMPPRLSIRQALYGGRTEPIRVLYDCEPTEELRYVDFCSLYPYVNWFYPYPVSHPVIYTDPAVIDPTLGSYNGVALVKILPPTDLFLPVLPYRCNAKLMFPLCRKCCELANQLPCVCSDVERALTGVWATDEIKLAISKGYKILKVYEVYDYEEMTMYDKQSGEGGLFAEYVRAFLGLKQAASGYPPHVQTETQKDEYIKFYYENQGVLLDKEKICKNPGLRLTAKLFLNSCWGKFCERPNKTSTVFVKTPLEVAKLKNDPAREVMDFHIVNDDVIAVELRRAEQFEEDNTFQSDIVGVLTTTYGRLKLYEALDIVHESVCYMDTDSLIYADPKGLRTLPTGDLLGDLTDEIPLGTTIQTFVSSGPKSYAYRLDNGEQTVKLKGISLNHKNSEVLNFDVMKKVILGELDSVMTPLAHQISRTKYDGIIYRRAFSKTYRMVFSKRVLPEGSHVSIPYGFRGLAPYK